MESVSNVSSEEELLQLRNEGKISETEYEELRETLRKTAKLDVGPALQDKPKPVRTSGLAIASLVLLVIPLACWVLRPPPSQPGSFIAVEPIWFTPAIVFAYLAWRKTKKDPTIRGTGLALAVLIIGCAFFVVSMFPTLRMPISGTKYKAADVTILKQFPMDNMDGIVTQSGIQIDEQISSDGNGSLRIEATERTTVRLFETGYIDIENARLIYQARLRTEDVEGQVYLEMWCHFAGVGNAFSRGLLTPLTGTTEWTTEEIPFFLKKGENPDNVKLNLVINGKGTVWIDDIRLLKGPLNY